jgi:hypothetical protein
MVATERFRRQRVLEISASDAVVGAFIGTAKAGFPAEDTQRNQSPEQNPDSSGPDVF